MIREKLSRSKFCDLDSLNAAIRVALELHNNTPLTDRKCSRREQFEEIERDSLCKLNPIRFEFKQCYKVTAMKNGHVRLWEDVHYYSVPCRYIGKKVIYPIIERIFNNRRDEFPLEESAGQETEMHSHENIRGKEYYQ